MCVCFGVCMLCTIKIRKCSKLGYLSINTSARATAMYKLKTQYPHALAQICFRCWRLLRACGVTSEMGELTGIKDIRDIRF